MTPTATPRLTLSELREALGYLGWADAPRGERRARLVRAVALARGEHADGRSYPVEEAWS